VARPQAAPEMQIALMRSPDSAAETASHAAPRLSSRARFIVADTAPLPRRIHNSESAQHSDAAPRAAAITRGCSGSRM